MSTVAGPLPELRLDLEGTPFSRRGSYLAVSRLRAPKGDGVYLRSAHGDARERELLRLVVGGEVQPAHRTDGTRLDLEGGGARVLVALDGPGRALLRLERGELALEAQVRSQWDVVLPDGVGTWRFVASGAFRNHRIAVRGGSAELDADWDGVASTRARLVIRADGAPVDVLIEEFGSTPPSGPAPEFDGVVAAAAADLGAWLRHGGSALEHADATVADATRLAAFVTWGALVPPGGLLRRESMLMSKNWMTNIWSWDHCFNAMALWRDPAAAADQLLTLFDHQDEHGALPDYVNETLAEWNFVKPPIHGWAVEWLLDRGGLERDALAELYRPLAAWTAWWSAQRDHVGDGVPSYHHGNDSGWDNSTVFAGGVPAQSPDLLAFLALQLRALGRIADRLGFRDDARDWRERADATVRRLLDRCWTGDRFLARSTFSGEPIASDSLLTLMPLVLGELLPPDVFAAAVGRLETGGYLTAHGPATEPVDSPFYDPDGYWRGPIWAPTTMLLVDGLRRGGRGDLADDIAARFVATCARAGMAENFDALTGEGRRDLAMTWTASVFLLLVAGGQPVATGRPAGAS